MDKDTYATVVPDLHRAWVAPMAAPTLVNFDGDPLSLARAYFDIAEAEATVAALDAARELERVEPEGAPPRWDWSGEGRNRKEPVLFGWVTIDGQRLVLETNSLERVERGRKLIERVLGRRPCPGCSGPPSSTSPEMPSACRFGALLSCSRIAMR